MGPSKRPGATPERSRSLSQHFIDPGSYITKGGRVRLKGADYSLLRWLAYCRADGMCECGCGRIARYDDISPLRERGEFAHNEHGGRKSDELHRGRWLNSKCHRDSHNAGGKPCPRKESVHGIHAQVP